jgi:Pyruvoyl-dependent arginine decarboxylase (PvlArgDC)
MRVAVRREAGARQRQSSLRNARSSAADAASPRGKRQGGLSLLRGSIAVVVPLRLLALFLDLLGAVAVGPLGRPHQPLIPGLVALGRRIHSSIGPARPTDPVMYGYVSAHHGFGMTAEESGEYAEDLAAGMLASTPGIESDPEAAWNERK